MMPLVEEWAHALRKELDLHKGKVAILFAIVTLAVLAVGFVWPKMYQAGATIFADQQNIIAPLLKGQAEITRPDDVDQLSIVRERLLSPAVLGQVLLDTKQVQSLDDRYVVDPKLRQLQSAITIEEAGKNHFRISYKSKDQNQALNMATVVVNAFVRDSAQSKRKESREAFQFIDSQVKTYQSQLQEAETRLKDFRTANPGASSENSGGRISTLRSTLEELKLELQTAMTRRNGLQHQLSQESQSISRQYKSDVYREAMIQAQSKLDTLRLSYQETYPDIVALKQQIEDLKQSMARAESEPAGDTTQVSAANPVYQRLKSDLAETDVQVRTLQMRVSSAEKMIGEEHGQSKENAEFQARLAELTRDYTVTKSIYEDMLERREKARLSMALDIQGQGVTYKIKEPPVYPNSPIGLRFMHFFLAAPILGLLIPIGLLVAYIQLDPRIRFSERLHASVPEGIPVLAVIPHYRTAFDKSVAKGAWASIALLGMAVLVIYIGAGVARLSGVL
jgi:polysaccharide chain length determinant protein (PEP-CTERM system associated)